MNFKIGDPITREQAQALALSVAAMGTGFVSPNPLVGCVIVDKNHCFLSTGFHARYGEAHAEVNAVNKVQPQQLVGATVYITLEPCSHFGKTPPCADLLSQHSLKKVIVGHLDPNPLVSGRGIAALKKNNIDVEMDAAWSVKCAELAEIFLWHVQTQTPYVALKVATSLDGQLALASGESQWITSEESRRFARQLRAGYDALFVGAQTLINDNPLLDFRDTPWEGKKTPRVVILDPHDRAKEFFPRSNLAQKRSSKDVLFVSSVDEQMLKSLYKQGIYSLYVEGGAKTHSLFLQTQLFNKIYCFLAPTLLGRGLQWTESLTTEKMSDRLDLRFGNTQSIGPDLLLSLYRKK